MPKYIESNRNINKNITKNSNNWQIDWFQTFGTNFVGSTGIKHGYMFKRPIVDDVVRMYCISI